MPVLDTTTFESIRTRGELTAGDVAKLRRAFYVDGRISDDEAAQLIALHRACTKADATWAECFVEMLTDYLVNQAAPEGYITLANAEWLISQVAPGGNVTSRLEFDLLVNVLDKARWAPQSLVKFTLQQVRDAVILGVGPLARETAVAKPFVSDAEVELVRRVIYAFGGDDNVTVTMAEADILFEINDATLADENAQAWGDLFVKAIANCVLSASGYAVPSREQAMARDAWLDRRGDLSVGRMLTGMFAGYREIGAEDRAIARLERQKIEIVTGEAIALADAHWLADRLGRDGKLSPNEEALMSFVLAAGPKLAPELQALVEKLPRAA